MKTVWTMKPYVRTASYDFFEDNLDMRICVHQKGIIIKYKVPCAVYMETYYFIYYVMGIFLNESVRKKF